MLTKDLICFYQFQTKGKSSYNYYNKYYFFQGSKSLEKNNLIIKICRIRNNEIKCKYEYEKVS